MKNCETNKNEFQTVKLTKDNMPDHATSFPPTYDTVKIREFPSCAILEKADDEIKDVLVLTCAAGSQRAVSVIAFPSYYFD